jgi:hypothetical protein
MYAPLSEQALGSELRMRGHYGDLAERARERRQALARASLQEPTLANAGVTEAELWSWYFAKNLDCPIPADLSDYAARAGFGDVARMRRAALRALCHERLQR